MGISFSCPFSSYNDLENGLQSVLVKSIGLGGSEGEEEPKGTQTQRSISFKGLDSEIKIMRSLGSGKMVLEGSISFKQKDIIETKVSINLSPVTKEDDGLDRMLSSEIVMGMQKQSPRFDGARWNLQEDAASPKHIAAIKLQKVYKSFRTRRKLADCAVLVEQSWWKLLDFAELKQSSISFFDLENQETAVSRWSRAKTKAAKVGKGLSKCEKAQKLALQHWLEAIDPRHRYGHNLHFYYAKWLESQSREPFFYWLDIGEGKEVNLTEKCPRSKLQQQCIKYLGPMERKAYEIAIKDGKLYLEQTNELLDTISDPHSKWIFVLSTSKTMYVGKKKKGTFQHSSFLAGGATSAAGRLIVDKGILKAVWPHSGHYKPTPENFQDFLSYLREHDVDLSGVEMNPVDEDEESLQKHKSGRLSSSRLSCTNRAEEDLGQDTYLQKNCAVAEELTEEISDTAEKETPGFPEEGISSRRILMHDSKLQNLEIPKRQNLFDGINGEKDNDNENGSAEDQNLSDEEEIVPKEKILQRIHSHKKTSSYQLGKHLSFEWTTGAGPRIGCLRDYPLELQFHALELVNLSPKSSSRFSSYTPRFPKVSNLGALTPTKIIRHKSTPVWGVQCSPLSKESEPL